MTATTRILVERFLEARTDLRDTTRVAYRLESKRLGDMIDCPVDSLSPSILERWAVDYKRRRCIRVIKTVYSWSVRNGLIKTNPAQGVRGPKIRTRTNMPFNRSMLGLPAQFDSPRDRALVQLLIDSGIRAREALGLDWELVDLNSGVIRIERSVSPKNGIQGLKTANSERDIAISRATVQALAALAITQNSGPVFRNRSGTRICLNNWSYRVWKPTLKKLDLRIRLHDLRHFCATTLLEAGATVAAVQQRLGHASSEITTRFYARRSIKLSKDMASLMDNLFDAEGSKIDSGGR
jgi:integrase